MTAKVADGKANALNQSDWGLGIKPDNYDGTDEGEEVRITLNSIHFAPWRQ